MMAGGKESVKTVPTHEKGKVLTAKYLADLETSIKARTALNGTNIDILYVDGGSIISVTGSLANTKPIQLTVCSNGTPAKITVLSVV